MLSSNLVQRDNRLGAVTREEMYQVSQSQVRVAEAAPLRILVVDDEPPILNFLKMGLLHEGYEVATAEDAAGALAQVTSFKPQLVVLDLMLPGMDGLELAGRLRR